MAEHDHDRQQDGPLPLLSSTGILLHDGNYLFFSTRIMERKSIFAKRDFGDGLVQTPHLTE